QLFRVSMWNGSTLLRATHLAILVMSAGTIFEIRTALAADSSFPHVESLPTRRNLQDPLIKPDGSRVKSRNEWFKQRRPELKAMFEHYMYGVIPPRPKHMATHLLGEYTNFLEGEATLKLLTLDTGGPAARQIDLMLVLPNRSKPAPVFLTMDFCGNQAITDDPHVPLAHSWMTKGCP